MCPHTPYAEVYVSYGVFVFFLFPFWVQQELGKQAQFFPSNPQNPFNSPLLRGEGYSQWGLKIRGPVVA